MTSCIDKSGHQWQERFGAFVCVRCGTDTNELVKQKSESWERARLRMIEPNAKKHRKDIRQ